MKAAAVVVAFATSASAHVILTSPLVSAGESISAGSLTDTDATAATTSVTHTSNMTSTSTASPAPRHIGWVTRVQNVTLGLDLESAATTTATTEKLTTPTSTLDGSVKATGKVRGGADVVDQLRSIVSSSGAGCGGAEEGPAATLCIAEHHDMMRTMTKTTRTQARATVTGQHTPNTEAARTPPKMTTATTTSVEPREGMTETTTSEENVVVTVTSVATLRADEIRSLLKSQVVILETARNSPRQQTTDAAAVATPPAWGDEEVSPC